MFNSILNWVSKWIFSTNHKIISYLYFFIKSFVAVIAITLSLIIRIEFSSTGNVLLQGNYQLHNVIVTAHGLLMVFFVVMPILIGGFGNFFLPILIDAPDMAFPRLNNLSFWLLPSSLFLLITSLFIEIGWTVYSSLNELFNLTSGVDFSIFSLPLVGIFSLLSPNYIN